MIITILQALLAMIILGVLSICAILKETKAYIITHGWRQWLQRLFHPSVPYAQTAHTAAHKAGYTLKNHLVTTSDGFLLTLHHLISDQPATRGPVFLQHGLYQSSMLFLVGKRSDSLAYVLSDMGYDVWLGNTRGNIHSRAHIEHHVAEKCFWNWGVDELALDVKENVEYIVSCTNQPVYYIGHSQGATQGLVAFSSDDGLQKQVTAFIALAPGAYVKEMPCGPLRLLANLVVKYPSMFESVCGTRAFLPFLETLRAVIPTAFFHYVAYVMFNYLFNWGDANWDVSCKPSLFSETPAGTSTRTIAQWMQQSKSQRFQKFCYGKENDLYYGQMQPPDYAIDKIKIPTAVIYGGQDKLIDFQKLIKNLSHCVYSKEVKHHEHLDTLLALDAKDLVYPDILTLLETYPVKSAPIVACA